MYIFGLYIFRLKDLQWGMDLGTITPLRGVPNMMRTNDGQAVVVPEFDLAQYSALLSSPGVPTSAPKAKAKAKAKQPLPVAKSS